GHGREEIGSDIDVSRTVGWFTTVFPVLLDVAGAAGPGEALRAVKEQLRGVPRRGLGYGLLLYLSGDETVAAALRGRRRAGVGFNSRGQLDRVLPPGTPLALAREASGAMQSRHGRRPHLFDLVAGVVDGRLQVNWIYSGDVHRRETVARLADGYLAALRGLLGHCLSDEAGGYSPSDFPLAGLTQEGLDRLLGTQRGVEDLYPLSPLQQGLLFHTVYAPQSGVYCQQLRCTFHGALDTAALRQAWQRLLQRHTALRSAFVWEGLAQPLQVVHRRAELPWAEHDVRGLDAEHRDAFWGELVAADRRRGFALGQAPLLRAAAGPAGRRRRPPLGRPPH